jgi:zinc transport system permease protein
VIEFIRAAMTHPFLQNALLTGLLASLASGVLGTYVVVRRITYIAGGIAHSVLAGMGLVGYLNHVWGVTWIEPLWGALIAAVISALIIGWTSLKSREREDTVISAIWAIGMSLGVIFIYQTPGYAQDLMSYLFGNILMVSARDLWLLLILDLVALGVVLMFHRQLTAICFDEEFARVRGIKVPSFYLVLLILIALTVVILSTVVGVVMVIALLTLPVAIAGKFAGSISKMMIWSSVIAFLLMTFGLMISYMQSLPAGATIVVLAGLVYLASLLKRATV